MSNKVSHSAKRINRADLLRALQGGEDSLLSSMAEVCGFEPPPKPNLTLKTPYIEPSPDTATEHGVESLPSLTASEQKQQAYFYRVIDRKQSEWLPEPVDPKQKVTPEWLEQTAVLNPDAVVSLNVTPPEKQPLVAWSKLWPVLRALLSEQKRTRQPDVPRIVRTIADGHWLERIPRKTRQRWTARVHILIERAELTCLFNQDYNRLLEQLKQLRGVTGLELQRLLRQPGGRVRVEGKQRIVKDWHVPPAGTTVFILSDLGLLDESGITQRAWLRVGQQMRLAGCRPLVLLPLPERYLNPELVALFDCMSWDRGSKLQKVVYVPPLEAGEHSPLERDRQSAEDLLAWLSSAVRVEPALLRAVRHQLPTLGGDVGQEAAAWHHEDVIRSSIGIHFQPQKQIIEKYRQRFTELSTEFPELALKIAGLIYEYHRHAFPTQRYEEILLLDALLGDKARFLREDLQEEVVQAQQHMRELVKAGWEQVDVMPNIRPFLMHQLERQHEAMIRDHDFYQVVWGLRQHKRGELVDIALPEGFDLGNVLAYTDARFSDSRDYVLFQQGYQGLQLSTRQRFEAGDEQGFKTGCVLASLTTASKVMFRQLKGRDGKISHTLSPLPDDGVVTLPLEELEIQQVEIAGQSLTIERFQKPKWADRMSCGHQNSITASSGGVIYYWHEPKIVSKQVASLNQETRQFGSPQLTPFSYPGFWYPAQDKGLASMKPVWAKSIERDWFGLSVEVEMAGIPQRFRWIEPTHFLMGSPKDEEGRYDDETQHPVTLTQGYWLADTACTQAVWQAVMGKNPSQFKGADRPVENVSWKDITDFLKKLNRQQPELKLQLPTDAQWENACRAGTTTVFSFGENITPEQVNYNGNNPYHNGKKGQYRKETVQVRSLPSNPWGLYEMHGNVYEWCSDWFESFSNEAVIDPVGSEAGGNRVLRGGSWFDDGRRCRSAFRYRYDPGLRYSFIGFRLARGLELPASPAQSSRQNSPSAADGRTRVGRGGDNRGMTGDSLGTPSDDAPTQKKSNSALRTLIDKYNPFGSKPKK